MNYDTTTYRQRILNDKQYYVPVVDGKRILICSDTDKKEAIYKAKREGLKDYKIETFWSSEYE